MKDFDDPDDARPRAKKKKKKKRPQRDGRWRFAFLAGGALLGLAVVGLLVWGLVSLFSGKGVFGPVAAEARAAEPVAEGPLLPADQVPVAAAGWKVTPDGAPLASGLASAIPLPEGRVAAFHFADPSRARAAVVLAGPVARGAKGATLNWVQLDLKAGTVAARVPLGTFDLAPGYTPPESAPVLLNSALSPSGDRLALLVAAGGGTLRVLDAAGNVVRDWTGPELPGGDWLAFTAEDRLLVLGKGRLTALEVSSGKPVYSAAGEVRGPLALSPGRRWVCATNPADDLNVFDTADGSPAGRWPGAKVNGAGVKALGFHPDGTALSALFVNGLVTWDTASGRPVRAVRRQNGGTHGHPAGSLLCLGPRYMYFFDYLYDAELDMGLWRYDAPQPSIVSHGATPDGRLWAAGSFKDVFTQAQAVPGKLTPGPIAYAGLKGQLLVAAFTVPHAEVLRRVEAGQQGIPFRTGGPVRIEVTGKADREHKRVVAQAAAEAAAKRGIAVDPSARSGIRIEVSDAKSVKVAFVAPGTPKSVPVNPNMASREHLVEAAFQYFNSETGGLTQGKTVGEHRASDVPGWEAELYKRIGKTLGETAIPLSGYYDKRGADVMLLSRSRFGVDGVVEPLP